MGNKYDQTIVVAERKANSFKEWFENHRDNVIKFLKENKTMFDRAIGFNHWSLEEYTPPPPTQRDTQQTRQRAYTVDSIENARTSELLMQWNDLQIQMRAIQNELSKRKRAHSIDRIGALPK